MFAEFKSRNRSVCTTLSILTGASGNLSCICPRLLYPDEPWFELTRCSSEYIFNLHYLILREHILRSSGSKAGHDVLYTRQPQRTRMKVPYWTNQQTRNIK